MAQRRVRVAVSVAICGWWVTAATISHAQVKVTGSNERRSIECNGGTVSIIGGANELTLRGACKKVDITGAGNTVAIESVGAIEVSGANNRITWQDGLDGRRPRVSRTGLGNVVSRAPAADRTETPPATAAPPPAGESRTKPTPAPARSPEAPRAPDPPAPASASGTGRHPGDEVDDTGALRVLTDDTRRTIPCEGRTIAVLGSRNTLALEGRCPTVRVSGDDNEITIARVDRLEATGVRNRLTWTTSSTEAGPRVVNTGKDNVISRARK